jgi:hypothetical protein
MLALVACGDDETKNDAGSNGGDDGGASNNNGVIVTDGGEVQACADLEAPPKVPDNGIAYPDAVCDGDECQVGGCDPLGRCSPACNAWHLKAKVSFQSAKCSEELDLGFPEVPTREGDDDVCNGTAYMISNSDAEVNCCQRADNLKAKKPMLKLTGLQMTQPLGFAGPAVTGTNKKALESDWYNSVIVLDSAEDGDRTASVGNALPNEDGSFFPLSGSFESAGMTFNKDGKWDVQEGVSAVLSTTDEGRLLKVGPTASDRNLVLVLWGNAAYDYTQLALPMRGIEYSLPLSPDLSCAGERKFGVFDQVGTLTAFLPLAAMRDTNLFLSKSDKVGTNLCTLTSGATSCGTDVSKWKPQP